jgi:hypothetical protein
MQRDPRFFSLLLPVTLATLAGCTEMPEARQFDFWETVGDGEDGTADATGTSDGAADDGSYDGGSDGDQDDGGSYDGDSGDGDSGDGDPGDGSDGDPGDGDPGDGDGDGDQQGGDGDSMCVPVPVVADVLQVPADIFLIVDNSSTMTKEAAFVQAQMNDFSAQLETSGVDHHIILISSYPDHNDKGICVGPPLGSGDCPNTDDNPPLYRHVDETVGSHNALAKLIASQNEWQDSVRPESVKHIVVVSDDESQLGSNAFEGQFHALGDDYDSFEFHAIVCPWACPEAGEVGQVYIDLVYQTGGVLGDLCQQDFQPVFEELADAVIQKTPMSCHFDIPSPPMGMNLDHNLINVELDDGGKLEDIPRVEGLSDCMNNPEGWYYDDFGDPTQIYLCPQSCEKVQGYGTGAVNVKFGCETLTAK